MQLGIIGLARSGKTTIFNAVTRGTARVGDYSSSNQPNIGVVTVPDERVDALARLYKPRKTTYATIQYVDFPAAAESFGKGEGPAGKFINDLARMDALIHVVRAFRDDAVPHPEGTIDPDRDIQTMDLELAFADLAIIERRLQRLEAELRSLKASERERPQRLKELLERLKHGLESDVPIRAQVLSDDDRRLLEGTRFLTALPMLLLINIGEEDLPRRAEIEAEFRQRYAGPGRDVAVMAGKFEMDLNELSEEDAAEFRASAGVTESGMANAIRLSYALLGLISFLTAGPDECRAWTIPAGATAPEAAGKIHSDLQRGFIRAEVIRWDDLVAAGSEAEAKKRGLLRTEGKNYVVQDGDVLHILFNV
ncbi:redox-regulated ATPase YchF [Tepidiforma sp.]|uniref:redox-regulated ATPase YchF n=1 Tax=Tepidiforma sp. TaxID=2682230 RepID=UPI002ADE7784|nr:redox-regulated ATPase YchF [Tepidiforma sp.]